MAKSCLYTNQYITAAYYAMIELIDTQVGKIITALEETNQMENTIVIFMSDHGMETGELYDLKSDPDEFVNLWDSKAQLEMKIEFMKVGFDASTDHCPEKICNKQIQVV